MRRDFMGSLRGSSGIPSNASFTEGRFFATCVFRLNDAVPTFGNSFSLSSSPTSAFLKLLLEGFPINRPSSGPPIAGAGTRGLSVIGKTFISFTITPCSCCSRATCPLSTCSFAAIHACTLFPASCPTWTFLPSPAWTQRKRQLSSDMGFEMGSHAGRDSSVDTGISRGNSPEWKNLWSEISSMEGRLCGSGQRREVIRSFASSDTGFVAGNSY